MGNEGKSLVTDQRINFLCRLRMLAQCMKHQKGHKSPRKCTIGGTIFLHKNTHKLTWKSPDGRTTNQIDHVIVNNKWRRSLHNVRVSKRADVNSDYYSGTCAIRHLSFPTHIPDPLMCRIRQVPLLKVTIRLKLHKTPPSQNQCRRRLIPDGEGHLN